MHKLSALSALLFAAISLAVAPASAQGIEAHSTELSGSLAFTHVSGDNNSSVSTLQVSPGILYYPASAFFIGPMFTYISQWNKDISQSQMVLGGQLGAVASGGSSSVFPFAGGGFGMTRTAYDYEDLGGPKNSQTGTTVVLYAGLKIRLAGSFFLNIQPLYNHTSIKSSDADTFAVGLGFSGFI